MKVHRIQSQEDIHKAFPCTTEVPIPFWVDGLPMCREWLIENLGEHIEGLHLEDEKGTVIGHIYWAPSQQALAPYMLEDGVAYIYCDWVQEQYRQHGCAHLLFDELVQSLRNQDYKGILVEATDTEGYMYYQHFLKRGFSMIGENEGNRLMYYPLSQPSIQIKPIAAQLPRIGTGEVEVLVIGAHFCPVGASAIHAVRKVAREFGDKVVLKELPASREIIEKYGVADGIFINGKAKFFGPVHESHVRQAIAEEIAQ